MDRRKFFTATFVGAAAAEIGEEAVTVLQGILGVGGVVSAALSDPFVDPKESTLMADNSDVSDFIPPAFSFALTGHLATGAVKVVAIALLLWGLGLTGWTASFPAGTAIITAVVVMVAVELATTGVERIFVLRHRHPDPGSVR